MSTKYIHPETGKEYTADFIGLFAVISDRKTEYNQMNYSVTICLHKNYDVAKRAYDEEVAMQKSDDFQEESKSVLMINRTNIMLDVEGLIVHKWTNY